MLASITILFYCIGLVSCMRQGSRVFAKIFLGAAIALQAIFLWVNVQPPFCEHLSATGLLLLSAWLAAIGVYVGWLVRAWDFLMMSVAGIAVCALSMWCLTPAQPVLGSGASIGLIGAVWHVGLATIITAIIIVAGIQALWLIAYDYGLRVAPFSVWVKRLPPLLVMEQFLFQLVIVAFVLLSVLLSLSIYLFLPQLLLISRFKLAFVGLSWMVLAALLCGRYGWGWRGRRAVWGTLSGVLLLNVVYLGFSTVFA